MNDKTLRKRLDRQKDGRKDGHTLFYRTLPATAGGQKKCGSMTALHYNFEVFQRNFTTAITSNKI